MIGIKRAPSWLLIGLVAVAVLSVGGPPAMRRLASVLVAHQPAGDFQYVGILEWRHGPNGDRCYDAAAKLCGGKPSCGILLVASRPDRLLEVGALPSFEALSRRELEARGVPWWAVSVATSDGHDHWATARTLRKWLADRPNASVVVLCEAFSSGHLRYVLDTVLEPAQAARVRLQALRDRYVSQMNWWRSRRGIKAFGVEWLRRLHGWCVGGDHRPPPYQDADQYEKTVQRHCCPHPNPLPAGEGTVVGALPAGEGTVVGALPAGEGTPERADYVMQLNGDEQTRPFVTAAILKAGLARHALLAEMAVSPLVEDHVLPPSHEISRQVMLKRGVAESDVTILPAAVATTRDEAESLAAFLRTRPRARVLVVTNEYHVPRSRWVFARVLGDLAGQVSFVSAPSDQFPADRWWRDEAAFLAIATEPPKFAFYVLSYGHMGYWLASCAGLAVVAVWIRRRRMHHIDAMAITSKLNVPGSGTTVNR